MENENKQYFTPDIEDIKIGYFLEWRNNHIKDEIWKEYICDIFMINRVLNYWNHEIPSDNFSDNFRVPYLTKEQIEAEGWNCTSLYNYQKIKSNINAYYGDDRYIWIMHPAEIVKGEKYISNSFKGECKSINEFRYICKLLNIK